MPPPKVLDKPQQLVLILPSLSLAVLSMKRNVVISVKCMVPNRCQCQIMSGQKSVSHSRII
jgi:hypothetical protein